MDKTRGTVLSAVAAALMAALAFWVPLAQAAAPANDDFGNREVLNAPLPIEVTRTNVEATSESPEDVGLFANQHSVWFDWQATMTGWVTVNTCASPFSTVLGIFTGTELSNLHRVAEGNADEGPDCVMSAGRELTFKATTGTHYSIAVAGNAFYLPPSPPPAGEGTFPLLIEATPDPPNDDFADAAPIDGTTSEEPDGHRMFMGVVNGFNWNATDEPEEPDHAGVSLGASVWYRWTAPETGVAHFSVTATNGATLAAYSGASLSTVTPLSSSSNFPTSLQFAVTAGSEYSIAIDGAEEHLTGEAAEGSFNGLVWMELAPGPGERSAAQGPPRQGPPPDLIAPETTILERSVKPGKRKATFNFTSSEAGGGFRCQLDNRPLGACNPPKTYSGLGFGKHVFRVAAVDSAGNTDPSAAIARFAIPKPKARHRNAH